jgi:DNA-binding SARP family transcriptional activator
MALMAFALTLPDLGSVRAFRRSQGIDMVFELQTFGGLRFFDDAGRELRLATQRERALLLFVALHRGAFVHRESLCAALWPDASEASGRANLRKTLWRLRSARAGAGDPGPLIVSDYQIGLDPAQLRVDLWDFVDAWARLQSKSDADLDEGAGAELTRAIGLNKGLFGLGIYDDWLVAEQRLLAETRIQAMDRMAQFYRKRGDLNQSIGWAQRALSLDPLREHLHAAIIECRYSMGDRALAIRQFHECSEVLRREVGVAPSAQVRALYDRLTAET